jgi:hypothetical protein
MDIENFLDRDEGIALIPSHYFWRDAVLLFLHWLCFDNAFNFYKKYKVCASPARYKIKKYNNYNNNYYNNNDNNNISTAVDLNNASRKII